MTDQYSESLADRVAIVTGGSRGIGLATAMVLRAEGADVLVCGRSEAALGRAGAQLVHTPGSGRVATVVADVRRHSEAERLVTAAVDELGTVVNHHRELTDSRRSSVRWPRAPISSC